MPNPKHLSFENRLTQVGDCLLWTGPVCKKWGYGKCNRMGETLAHRAAYKIKHGSIPSGMLVCHTCDTPACCNVDHLFLGTNADNMRDMAGKKRGRNWASRPDAENIKKKVSAKMKGVPKSDETRKRLATAALGRRKVIVNGKATWEHLTMAEF